MELSQLSKKIAYKIESVCFLTNSACSVQESKLEMKDKSISLNKPSVKEKEGDANPLFCLMFGLYQSTLASSQHIRMLESRIVRLLN